MKKDHLFIILLFIGMLIISGCARTVTERVPAGERLVASVSFAGDVDFANNKYYMLIGSNSNYQLPFSPYEFIEPGIPPTDPQVNYYNYYSTWKAYIVIDTGIVYLVPGPFISSSETYSRIQIGGPIEVGRNISFQLRLEQVWGDALPDVIYFDFVSTDSTKFLKDHLTPPSKSIMKYDGMIISGSDEGESAIDPSLNVLNWSVSVQ